MTTYQKLLEIRRERGAGYLVLLDPDRQSVENLTVTAQMCQDQGVDALLIGGSLISHDGFDTLVRSIKPKISIPIIIFPGDSRQLSRHADAVFFMSLISGRNPQFLIGEQVMAAPVIRSLKLEAISLGYMLVESGQTTSVEFISGTKPLPRDKPGIAVAHALAAEYFGMKMLYLEAGSGAAESVPEAMIRDVSQSVSLPVIVGGGVRTPETVLEKVKAGASFVVTGNLIETSQDSKLIRQIADAVHT